MVGLLLSVAPLPSAALALLLVCGVVTTGESSIIYLLVEHEVWRPLFISCFRECV